MTNGIAVRMALLYLMLGGAGSQTAEPTGAEPGVVPCRGGGAGA